MIKFPKIFVDKFEREKNNIEIDDDFTGAIILNTFDGKNSIEDIYSFFLSEN